MWVSDSVDLNDELLAAQYNGKLVVFAGAGVSVAAPSNYPNFIDLSKRVNTIAASPLSFESGEAVDRFLGRLKKIGINVQQIVQRELTNPQSQPTELHRSILSLFNKTEDIKIVTTNFDNHFSTVASNMSLHVPIYKAPALPLGRDFNGIVYLHGSVEESPGNLVLTDEDFGQAYLTDGWATRFLAALFNSYTVLFIGYSHSDPIMQYLGRGLPPTSSRYAFEALNRDSSWKLFNIVPISFPLGTSGNKYQALNDAINEWGNLTQMDYIDHATRIRNLTKQDPKQLSRNEEDYILYCLKDFRLTRIFIYYAKDFKWLEWIEEKKVADSLFNPNSQVLDIHSLIARWIAENFICDKSEECLSMIQRNGQRVHPILWSSIAAHLNYRKRPESYAFAKWVSVLFNTIPTRPDAEEALTLLLTRCKHPDDASLIMLIFEFLMRPYMYLDRYINLQGEGTTRKVSIEVKLRGENFWLGEAYQNIILPNLVYYVDYLEGIVTTNLRNAHHILRAANNADADWDYKSFLRNAIEQNSQDQYKDLDGFGILLDAAKIVIEHYAQNRSLRIRDLVETWFASDVPLLKRLAIHGLIEATDVSKEHKVSWVLEKDIVFSLSMKPEIFRLLKICYPSLNNDLRKAVIQSISNYIEIYQNDNDDENERIVFRAYNLLSWLSGCTHCEMVTKKLGELQQQYPKFMPYEHPDLLHWGTVGFRKPRSPLSADELRDSDFSSILSVIINYIDDPFLRTERYGLLTEIQNAVSQNFDWSLLLFNALAQAENIPSDVWPSIFLGWRQQDISQDNWGKLIHNLLVNKHLYDLLGEEISSLLNHSFGPKYREFPKFLRELVINLSERIWENTTDKRPIEISNWLELSINRPSGKIVDFWLTCLNEEIKIQEKRQLLPRFKKLFNQILSEKSFKASVGLVILARNLGFLANLDIEWTKKKMFPRFDWSKEPQAIQMWQGYLGGCPWGNVLKYLKPFYAQTFDKLSLLDNAALNQFVHHMSAICVHAKTVDPLKGGWLIQFLRSCNQDCRVSWANHVSRELTTLDENKKLRIWKRWINQFLLMRLDGIPKIDSDKEIIPFYHWAPILGSAFPYCVDMLTKFAPPKFENEVAFHYILQNQLHRKFPYDTIKFITYVLNTHMHSAHSGDLLTIFNELSQLDIMADKIRNLRNSFVQSGCLEVLTDNS